ncbi:hypothetical protein EXIGLDRAFT_695774 [Exidia glandulosa HHB12029]|uniref:Uncharacterized protein n=1 Tax=Exidia glandulosa HHB12029 TaxID=1314781 RepID=A0A165FMI2_EXIGL|nr:hypothetical protein EXIGLDRAFT_695774 [Exidia glandulosa HHB12029]
MLFRAALMSLAAAVSVTTVLADCPGYINLEGYFSVGFSDKYVMDVTDAKAWDFNTTKVYYKLACDSGRDTVREVAFVNRDDCSPITSRYTKKFEKSQVFDYLGSGPTIDVLVDKNGTARFPCYGYSIPLFIYEVHFEGLHRSEQLAGLAFYDRVL